MNYIEVTLLYELVITIIFSIPIIGILSLIFYKLFKFKDGSFVKSKYFFVIIIVVSNIFTLLFVPFFIRGIFGIGGACGDLSYFIHNSFGIGSCGENWGGDNIPGIARDF